MIINVIGQGYIGLPTALMLASVGYDVVGTDINESLISTLSRGETTFSEEGLPKLFEEAKKNKIRFSTQYQKADIYIISVPTPYNNLTKKVNTKFVISAVESVMKVCDSNAILVIESTISPGSTERDIRPLVKKGVRLAHAPERIIPGKMLYELRHNSRTIGVDDEKTGRTLKEIYQSFCVGEIVLTDVRTAEISKVVENTYRDINIAFANELAKICHSDGMDVYEIIRIANKHPRVNIMQPGPGVGGHCIPVVPWFLVGDYPGLTNIILAARQINDSMPEFVLKRVSEIMISEGLTDISRIGLYGLTYKENVDDTRDSPTLQLIECMKRHLASPLKSYDPYIKYKITPNQCFSLEEFLADISLVVLMVGHDEIIEKQALLSEKIVIDTRNVLPSAPGVYKL